ncbi:MAG TPA: arsinothricin resistance N-acetyltransferase ArsN1 family B [Acidimicrobiia bacterium]|nr:arsinothricin resistance N-acetyltransferase ArsN1 family B [Acidimicrobiia bacterium]
MPRIRLVEAGDAAQLAAIYDPVVRETAVSFEIEPPGPQGMADRIENVSATHPWLVMTQPGKILGYAYATSHRQRPAYRWSIETAIYLDAEHRGRGLGKRLYNALLELATLWGYAHAFAGITLPNPASEALHASTGFQPIGIFPTVGFKMGEWHDVGWWHRPLSLADPPRQPIAPDVGSMERLLSGLS